MAYLYPMESKVLMRIAIQLHNEVGRGFKEKVYQDAFEVLLKENKIPYEREKHISMIFHGEKLEHDFFYDFLCYGKIGVELKALNELLGEHESQIINYLYVSEQQLGLLLNFGRDKLEYKWFPNRPNYGRQEENRTFSTFGTNKSL